MSKNYLELQNYFNFLDPAEQTMSTSKNKVNSNQDNSSTYSHNTTEFQSQSDDFYKSNPEL